MSVEPVNGATILDGHDPAAQLHCVKCNAALRLDADLCVECPRCGEQTSKQVRESLAKMRAARPWPPPSQESRAAATGQTRTK